MPQIWNYKKGAKDIMNPPEETSLSKENYQAMAEVRRSLWTSGLKGMGYGSVLGYSLHVGAKSIQSWSMKRTNGVSSSAAQVSTARYFLQGITFNKNTAFLSVMAGGALGAYVMSSVAGKNAVHNLHPVFEKGKNTFGTRYQRLIEQSQALEEEKERELRRLKRRETVIDRMAYGHGLSDSHGGHWTEEDEDQ